MAEHRHRGWNRGRRADADQCQSHLPPPSFRNPVRHEQPHAKRKHRASDDNKPEHWRAEHEVFHLRLHDPVRKRHAESAAGISPVRVMWPPQNPGTLVSMDKTSLETFSDQLAAVVASVAPSVVQVFGRRRPASGIVYADDVILTTTRALGREEGVRVTANDGRVLEAELAAWDPTTGLAVLRTRGLGASPVPVGTEPARVGQIAITVARSWSNAVTASAGIVAVIGGPLRTGRGQSIEQVIRTTAPMHDGFAGGAFVDAAGRVAGVATAAAIRGFGVIIPAAIAWRTAAEMLEHGRPRRGYLGLAGQPVQLAAVHQQELARERGLLIIGVTPDGPADRAGLLIGDVILEFDGRPVESAEDLLDLLSADRIAKEFATRLIRAGKTQNVALTVGERQP